MFYLAFLLNPGANLCHHIFIQSFVDLTQNEMSYINKE